MGTLASGRLFRGTLVVGGKERGGASPHSKAGRCRRLREWGNGYDDEPATPIDARTLDGPETPIHGKIYRPASIPGSRGRGHGGDDGGKRSPGRGVGHGRRAQAGYQAAVPTRTGVVYAPQVLARKDAGHDPAGRVEIHLPQVVPLAVGGHRRTDRRGGSEGEGGGPCALWMRRGVDGQSGRSGPGLSLCQDRGHDDHRRFAQARTAQDDRREGPRIQHSGGHPQPRAGR